MEQLYTPSPMPFVPRIQLHATRFRYADRRMICGRARLFPDRIELASWSLRGRRRRDIALGEILQMEQRATEHGVGLSIHLEGGEVLELHVDEAYRLRELFERWLQYDVLPSAKLVAGPEEALALSG